MIELKKIIALMPGNVYWKNALGVYQGCNNNMANILGLKSPKDIIGKTAHDLISPEKQSFADILVEEDNTIMRERKIQSIEEKGYNVKISQSVGRNDLYFRGNNCF